MRRNLRVLIMTVLLIVGLQASVAEASIGFMYNFGIEGLNEKLGDGYADLPAGGLYTGTSFMFDIAGVENLSWGIKTDAFSSKSNDKKSGPDEASVRLNTRSIEGVLTYKFELSETLSITAGANAGVNLLILNTRSKVTSFDELATTPNRLSLWRPYFIVGPHVALNIDLNIFIIHVTTGYYFNLGLSSWLDKFDKVEDSKEVLSSFSSVYLALGVTLMF